MSVGAELPNIAEALAALLGRIPREQQPLLIALAERMAAERYRGWAGKTSRSEWKASFLACADREEEIARRIEGLFPAAESSQRELLTANPDLVDINRSLFEPYSLGDQFKLQAQGERIGAATWRSFARHVDDPRAKNVFLACALLEEENATFLESISADAA